MSNEGEIAVLVLLLECLGEGRVAGHRVAPRTQLGVGAEAARLLLSLANDGLDAVLGDEGDVVVEALAHIHAPADAAGRPIGHDGSDALRIVDADTQRQIGAHAAPKAAGLLDLQVVEQASGLRGVEAEMEALNAPAGSSRFTPVISNDRVVLGKGLERLDELPEVMGAPAFDGGIHAAWGHHDERGAGARDLVVDGDAVNLGGGHGVIPSLRLTLRRPVTRPFTTLLTP